MEVKNYVTEDKYLVLDLLERELCKRGISYIRIDNEIHFQEKIVRVFDYEEDYNQIKEISFSVIVNHYPEIMMDNNTKLKELSMLSLFQTKQTSIPSIDIGEILLKVPKNYQPCNKRKKQQESHLVNQLLKKYKK